MRTGKGRQGDGETVSVSPHLPIAASPHLPIVFCGVAKLVRHRTVNAAMRRFESFRHSQDIADCQLPIANWWLMRALILR